MDNKRIIAFIDDETYRKQISMMEDVNSKLDKLDKFRQQSIWKQLNPITNIAQGIENINTGASMLMIKYGMKLDKLRRAGVTALPNQDASNYSFTPGHPREDEIYAAHPINSGAYFPLSDYHHATFESKTCELISLLMHLGATSISVQHKTGWGHEFAGSINVNIPGATDKDEDSGSASISGRGTHASDVLFEAKFKGNETPCLPEGMIWYQFEPTWKQMAEARMKFGSKEFQLTLDYSEDFGINADLVAKIKKVGGKISGEFSNHKKTVWIVKGEFA